MVGTKKVQQAQVKRYHSRSNAVACVKDVSLKKEIRVPFGAPLFLSKWYGVTTYFSLYKKIRKKNTNYKIHD